jgi:cytochrome c oxidase subunit 3
MSSQANAVPDVDVTDLPGHAFGHRAPIWWANCLLVCIELTAFVLVFAAALYVRDNFEIWPTRPNPKLLPGTLAVAASIASVPPTIAIILAARKEDARRTALWLAVAGALGVVFLACRAWELAALPWGWDVDAHASAVWLGMGLHVFEIVAGAGEFVFFAIVLCRSTIEKKTFADVEANCVFWFFVVSVWLPFYFLIYWAGRA